MGWEVDHKHEITFRRTAVLLNCGFASGLLQAFTFNPWDRALYLSVKNTRPFLTKANFEKPFAGVTQTVVQRAISSGLYFPLEEIFATLMNASEEKDEKVRLWKLFFAGTVAGAINGIVMNPFTRIKVNNLSPPSSDCYPNITLNSIIFGENHRMMVYNFSIQQKKYSNKEEFDTSFLGLMLQFIGIYCSEESSPFFDTL